MKHRIHNVALTTSSILTEQESTRENDRMITIAFGKSSRSAVVDNIQLRFEDLAQQCSATTVGEKDGTNFLRGPCKNGKRSDVNLEYAEIFIFEVDDGVDQRTGEVLKGQGPDPQRVSAWLAQNNISHFIYTSYSNQSEGKGRGWRYRVICQLPRPINKDENSALAVYFKKDLINQTGSLVAAESKNWAQLWFFPRVADQQGMDNFRFLQHAGAPISEELILRVKQTPTTIEGLPTKPYVLGVDAVTQRLLSAAGGDALALMEEINRLALNREVFEKLLERNGYTREGEKWKKPGSKNPAGVTLLKGQKDGRYLLCSHHRNDVLYEPQPDGTPGVIDLFEVVSRLKFKDEPAPLRKGLMLAFQRDKAKTALAGGLNPACSVPLLTLKEAINKLAWVENGNLVVHLDTDREGTPWAVAKIKYAASKESIQEQGKSGPLLKVRPMLDEWAANPQRLSFERLGFHPAQGMTMRCPEGLRALNMWKPLLRDGIYNPKLVSIFVDHIRWLFADRADDFLDWLAHIEQCPGVLPHTAWLHIAESTGMGRNWLANVLAKVWIGYVAQGFDLTQMLNDGFSDGLKRKLFVQVDEIRMGGSSRWDNNEKLKSTINCAERNINRKGVPAYMEHNFARWLLFSNHEDAIPIDDTDRRFEVVVSRDKPRSEHYYINIYEMLNNPEFINSVGFWLRARNISGFNPGRHAKLTRDKAGVLESMKSQTQRDIEAIIENHPADLIQTKKIMKLLHPDSYPPPSFTKAHEHALKRAGCSPIKKRLKINNVEQGIWAIRNLNHWRSEEISTEALRQEIMKSEYTPLSGLHNC